MSVSFRWGNQNLSLPKSENYIMTQMRDYISSGDKNFRTKVRIAKESVEGSEANYAQFKEQMGAVLEKVLSEPLVPELQKEADGWKMFSKLRDRKTDNEANLEYIEGKKLSDLLDSKVLARLKGTDVSFIRGGKTTLPPFDFDDWYSTLSVKETDLDVEYDLVFKENAKTPDVYSYGHTNMSPLENHIEAKFPNFDPDGLVNAKADYILEQTGQESRFSPSSGKFNITTENIDYSFKIPDSVISKLKGKGKDDFVQEVELREEDGEQEFVGIGERIPFTSNPEDEINSLNVQEALGKLNRTDTMKEEGIIELNDKYYYVKFTDVDDIKQARVTFPEGDGSPENFIYTNRDVIMRIVKPHLENPEVVYSVKLIGKINTKSKKIDSYRQYALNVQAEKDDKLVDAESGKELSVEEIERQSKMAYSHKTEKAEEYTNIKTGSKISASEYFKLEDNEKKNYSNKVFISEDEYNKLSSEDKKDYKSEIRLYDIKRLDKDNPKAKPSLSTREATDFGDIKYSVESNIPVDDIQEVFADDASVALTIRLIKHGEFNLSGARMKQNRKMATHTNKLKKNIRRLKKIVGV
jgi:hypothetical protein